MNPTISTIENCRFCLMCRHVAPVGHVTKNESVTPHGIALIASMQRQGTLTWNPSTLSVLYAEPDGGNCRAHCITDQALPAAIAAIRAEVAAEGLAPVEITQVHDHILHHHSVFGTYQPATLQGEWGLFVGDAGFHRSSDTVNAARQLLAMCKVDVAMVGCGLDSGFIPCSLGYPDTARMQAKMCIDEIQRAGVKKLLVLSPQDLFAFRQMYAERLKISWPEEVERIDLVDFLADKVREDHLRVPSIKNSKQKIAAYVDPTHAVRLPGRFDSARVLCEAALGNPPMELFWRRERAHPVGSTAIQFTRPDIGIQLTESRLEDATNRGAQMIVCEDPATLHELRLRNQSSLRVRGLYELLLERVT